MSSSLPNISPDLLKKYLDEINRINSEKTAKRKVSSLNRFFDWAQQKGHIESNPIKVVVYDKQPQTQPTVNAPTNNLGSQAMPFPELQSWSPQMQVAADTLTSNGNEAGIVKHDSSNVQPTPNVTSLVTGLHKSKFHLSLKAAGIGFGALTVIALAVFLARTTFGPTSPFIAFRNFAQDGSQSPTQNDQQTDTGTPAPTQSPESTSLPQSSPTSQALTALNLYGTSPIISALEGVLKVLSPGITLQTTPNSDGNITFAPDGEGQLLLHSSTTSSDSFSLDNANLTSGSLIQGYVGNNGTNYDLINLSSGSTPISRFSVDAQGNTNVGGSLTVAGTLNAGSLNVDQFNADKINTNQLAVNGNIDLSGDLKVAGVTRLNSAGRLASITGYYQDSGLFKIDQGSPDTVTISKSLTASQGPATSDSTTITLDEANTTASNYDTLVLNRVNAASGGYALDVRTGNAHFANDVNIDGHLTVGTFDVASDQTIGGNLIVKGNTTLGDGGDTTIINSIANITGDTSVGGTLNVTAATSLSSSLTVAGAAILQSTLGVTGDATFNGNITQSGTGTFSTGTGNVSLNGNTTVTGGNSLTVTSGTTSLTGTTNINTTGAADTSIGTSTGSVSVGTGTGNTAIGNSTGTTSITGNTWSINTAGLLSATAINNSGAYTQSGASANTFTGASSFTSAGTGLAVTNNATIGGTLDVTGATTVGSLNAGSGTIQTTGAGNFGTLAVGSTGQLTVDAAGNLSTSGNIATTGTGTLTSAGLITGNSGLTIAGITGITGATSINTSGSNATNIGTGTNAGTITIGNASTGDLALNDPNWSITGAGAANFSSLTVSGLTSSNGDVTLGSTNANTITFNGVVNSNINADSNGTRDLGTTSVRWRNGYFQNIDASTITGTIVTGSTTSQTWTINADNATANAETASVTFETGSNPINAVMQWNASGDAGRVTGYDDTILFNNPIALYSQVSGGNQSFTSGSLFKYSQNAANAITQSAAFIGTNIDFSSNITVPNSSSGNQTGGKVTLKDGGASATAIGFQTAGTLDYGIDLGGTIGTADIRLQNAETIDNITDGTVLITSPTTKTSGNVTVGTSGTGTITSGLINGQTISSAANFTGTVAIATSLTIGGGTALTTTNQTGTGSIVMSASPTLTGTTTIAALTQLGATSINTSGSNATNIGTGTNAGTITIGNTSTGDLALNDAQWTITGAGAASFASVAASGTINFSGLTPSRAVFTDGSSNLVTTGASSALLNALSDETGTGVAVFGTSPNITTSLTTGSSSFDLLNTTATTVNAFGAATSLTLGATSGTTSIRNATISFPNATTLTASSANAYFAKLGVGYDPSTLSGGVAGFNGNVGIGTTNPSAKLDISGNVDTTSASTQLVNLSPTFTSTSSSENGYGLNIVARDSTTNNSAFDFMQQSVLTLTGNASKSAIGYWLETDSSSTTADSVTGFWSHNTTSAGISSGTRSYYGLRDDSALGGNNTGGTVNLYSVYANPILATLNDGSTGNVYGGYFKADGTAINTGILNNYGVYIDNGTTTTAGVTTKYGLYIASQTGSDTNFNIYSAGTTGVNYFGGNVGIGTTAPGANLEVYSATVPELRVKTAKTDGTGLPGLAFWNGNNQIGKILSNDSSNLMSFQTGSTTKMVIDNGGNVGIGTTTPSKMLHLSSTGTSSIGLSDTDESANAKNIELYTAGGIGYLTNRGDTWAGGDNLIKMYIAAGDISLQNDKVMIKNSGNVGIGTTAPGRKLEVAGDITTDTQDHFLYARQSVGSDNYLTGLGFKSSLGAVLQLGNNGANEIRAGTTATGGAINFIVNNTALPTAANNGTLAMTLASSGNVGIGTSTPDLKFTINGDINTQNGGGLVLGHTAKQVISDGGGITSMTPEAQILGTGRADSTMLLASFGNGAAGNWWESANLAFLRSGGTTIGSVNVVANTQSLGDITWYGADGTDLKSVAAKIRGFVDGAPGTGDMPGGLSFQTTLDGAEDSTERMRITNGGNVGIGTTNPAIKLDVNGGIWTANAGTARQAFYDLAGNTVGVNSSLYSYGYICTSNSNGGCTGTGGVVLGGNNTSATVNIPNSGATFFNGGNVGIGTTNPTARLDVVGQFDLGGNGIGTGEVMRLNGAVTGSNTIGLYARAANTSSGASSVGSQVQISDGSLTVQTGVTVTTAADLYIAPQTITKQGTGAVTNAYSLYIASAPTGGTNNAALIVNSGNVGIGTTNPATPLEVAGGSIRIASGYDYEYGDTSTRIIGVSGASGYLSFVTNSGSRVRIDNNGNVGIGTTSPNTKLEVAGGSANTYEFIQSTGTGFDTGIQFTQLNGDTSSGSSTRRTWYEYIENTSSKFNISQYFPASGINTPRMTFDTGGNVGIGTTTPATKLDLAYGAGTTEANIKSNVANNLLTLSSNYTAGADYAPGISFSSKDNSPTLNKAVIYSRFTSSGSYLLFGTSNNYGAGVTNTAMAIDYGGNVGIGSTTPGAALDVVGTSKFSSTLNANGNIQVAAGGNVYLNGGTTYKLSGADGHFDTINTGNTNDPLEINYRVAGPTKICASVSCATYSAYFDTGGNVGIGTTAPTDKFEVSGPITSTAGMGAQKASSVSLSYETGTPAGRLIVFGATGGATNGALRLVSANSAGGNQLTWLAGDTGGNVGIGTTAPGQKLAITGGVVQGDSLIRSTGGTATGATGAGAEIQYTGSYALLDGYNRTAGAYIPLHIDGSTLTMDISGSPKLTIDASGNTTLTGTLAAGSSITAGTNTYLRVGNAYLSSGGDFVHLATHEWYNGSAWQCDGTAGVLFQETGQVFNFLSHDAACGHTGRASIDASGNINSVTGGFQINGTTVVDTSRNLTNIASITYAGNFVATQTYHQLYGSSNGSTGIQVHYNNGTTKGYLYGDATGFGLLNNNGSWMMYAPDGSQNVTFPGNISAGTYNGQTISSAANFTGTLTTASNLTMNGSTFVTNGSSSTYGALTIQGSKNTWSGISFRNSSGTFLGTLMVDGTNFGYYNSADNAWNWYWANGTLQTGTVPGANVSGNISGNAATATTASNISAGALPLNTWMYAPGNNSSNRNWYIGGSDQYWETNTEFHWRNASDSDIAWLTTGGAFTATQQTSSPIYYDNNNGSYYLDPASSSNLNNVTASSFTATGSIYLSSPGAGWIAANSHVLVPYSASGDTLFYKYGQTGTSFWFRKANCGVQCVSSYNDLFKINEDGHVQSNGYDSLSDIRLKQDIVSLPSEEGDILSKIMQLRGVKFNWNHTGPEAVDDRRQMGFIAQEVQSLFPDLVTESLPGPDSTDPTIYLAVDYSKFAPILLEGIKELNTKVDSTNATNSAIFADINLSGTTSATLSKNTDGSYSVFNLDTSSIVTRIATFTKTTIATIQAGIITTQTLVANAITVKSLTVQTALITPTIETDSLQVNGDATVSGTLYADNIKANNIEGLNGTFENMIASSAAIQNIATQTVHKENQSLADAIRARIDSLTEKLNEAQVSTQASQTAYAQIQEALNESATSSASIAFDAANTWTASPSATLASADISNLGSVSILGDINAYGTTNLGNTYINGSFVLSSINQSTQLTLSSDTVAVIGGSLNLLASNGVNIMNGAMMVDASGIVTINNDLFVNGTIHTSNIASSDNLNINLPNSGAFKINNDSGTAAQIDASGSAQVRGIVIAAGNEATPSAQIAGEITTNATAGIATLPAGSTEMVINNPKVTDNTLIYVTPTSQTGNLVVYVKSKVAGTKFVVGTDTAYGSDITFNWWIIDLRAAQ